MHKRALGVAVGLVSGLMVAALTAFDILWAHPDGPVVELLVQHFYGYAVSWTGAAVGAFWGFAVGFVAGWFVAFVANFALALRVTARRHAAGNHSFLDYI
jgi:hypothetical protein